MNSVQQQHPARRKGEVNCKDPGRYLGDNCHLNPGRRRGEPNHEVWNDLVSMRLTSEAKRKLADTAETLSSANFDAANIENATAMIRAIGDSVAVLKSIVEIMPALERLISVNSGDAAARGTTDTSDQPGLGKLPPKKPLTNTSGWSSDALVEIHNLCAESRRTSSASLASGTVYDSTDDVFEKVIPPRVRYYNPN